MDSNMYKFINYDKLWIAITSLIGVEAGVLGVLGGHPLLVACSIFLLLFTSILISLDYSVRHVLIHAFLWVELTAWFVFMFRN